MRKYSLTRAGTPCIHLFINHPSKYHPLINQSIPPSIHPSMHLSPHPVDLVSDPAVLDLLHLDIGQTLRAAVGGVLAAAGW